MTHLNCRDKNGGPRPNVPVWQKSHRRLDGLVRATSTVAVLRMLLLFLVAFSLQVSCRGALAATVSEPANVPVDRATLQQGLTQFEAAGTPSGFALYERKAFAVIAFGSPGALTVPIAASSIGAGRVVAMGQYYLDTTAPIAPNVSRFLQNAFRWIAQGKAPTIGVLSSASASGAVNFLKQQGFSATVLSGPITASSLASINALALDATKLVSSADTDLVREWVRGGGGVIVWANGWAWPFYTAPGKSLKLDFLGNRLLNEAGIAWTEGYVTGSSVLAALPATLNALSALDYQIGGGADPTEVRQAKLSMSSALAFVPNANNALMQQLNALKSTIATIIPSPAQPFASASNPAQTAVFNYLANEPAELVTAHASATVFPGAVPASAPRISRSISLSGPLFANSLWQSTGIYAPPGEKVQITVSSSDASKGMVAIIGAHTDDLNNSQDKNWTRAPVISKTFPLANETNTVASAFGGLIYIKNVSGQVAITVGGAVEAPRFVAGVTSLAEWKGSIRSREAPWAELESNKIVVTVQSELIRKLDDPLAVLRTWDKVLDLQGKLAGWNQGENLPMRITFDQQISAGYMHSGYPVMAFLPSQKAFLSINELFSPNDDTWGFTHEFGHNHQNYDWTFDGTGEVTVNLFSMFALEGLYGRPKEQIGLNQMPSYERRRMGLYFSQTPSYARLTADAFDTLIPYSQLITGFGWNTFIDLFREYLNLPEAQLPSNDSQKVDQWVSRFSMRVGRNLGPFFQTWGFPVSSATLASLVHLPTWQPEPDFPSAYVGFSDSTVEISGSIKFSSSSGPALSAAIFRDGEPCGYSNVVNGYIRCNVPKGWSGVISFRRAGYTFSPSQFTIGKTSADRSIGPVIAFPSAQATTTISGSVLNNGVGLSDVFPVAAGADCRASDGTGKYSCVVEVGWSGNVSMSKGGYTIFPETHTVNNVTTPITGVDFTGNSFSEPMSPALNVSSGWNLLGNSVSASVGVASKFGDASRVLSVWKWNALAKRWAFFSPELADGGSSHAVANGYDFLKSIDAGEGFWVNAKQAFKLQMPAGNPIASSALNSLPSGWSLVSVGDNPAATAFNRVTRSSTPIAGISADLTSLWAWDTKTSKWFFYAPALEAQSANALADFINSNKYLNFATMGRKMSMGTGFWVRRP
jgi:hypothetical protein